MLGVPRKVGGEVLDAVATSSGPASPSKCVATPPRRPKQAQAPEEERASVSSVGTDTVGGGGVRVKHKTRLPTSPKSYVRKRTDEVQNSPLEDLTRTPLVSTELYAWASTDTPGNATDSTKRRVSAVTESDTSSKLPGGKEDNPIDITLPPKKMRGLFADAV